MSTVSELYDKAKQLENDRNYELAYETYEQVIQ